MKQTNAMKGMGLVLVGGLVLVSVTLARPSSPDKLAGQAVSKNEMPDGIYVRIIAYGAAFKAEWGPEKHDAQDLLKMIGELKPTVVNRFITGCKDPEIKVPVAPGQPEMTLGQFLAAAMKAGGPGCTIAPKVHLNEIWPDDYRMKAAQTLRDLPVTPRLTMLDLDCWFKKNSSHADNKKLLQQFRDMGWTNLVFNPGPYKSAYGYESSVMTYMSEKRWQVPEAKIKGLHQKGIRLPLLHIDYPYQINIFRRLPPDRQAKIIEDIRSAQTRLGFRFIYPILMGDRYDSTRIFTSKDGPYHGASLYEVMKGLIALDRRELEGKRGNTNASEPQKPKEEPAQGNPT